MESMRNLLRTTLGRSLSGVAPLDRLAAAWPVVCGSVMARRGELLTFETGILTIRVADGPWLEQMLSMRSTLEHDLARIAEVPLTAIHFEKTTSRGPAQPPAATPSSAPARPAFKAAAKRAFKTAAKQKTRTIAGKAASSPRRPRRITPE